MQYLVSLLLFFILSSCSNQESFQFSGDWKLQSLSADNEIIPFAEPAPVTSFRSDNLVFYYNTLMRYELTNDSGPQSIQKPPVIEQFPPKCEYSIIGSVKFWLVV